MTTTAVLDIYRRRVNSLAAGPGTVRLRYRKSPTFRISGVYTVDVRDSDGDWIRNMIQVKQMSAGNWGMPAAWRAVNSDLDLSAMGTSRDAATRLALRKVVGRIVDGVTA